MQSLRLKNLTREHVAQVDGMLAQALGPSASELMLDFAEVRSLDSAGAALLMQLLHTAAQQRCRVQVENVHPTIARRLATFPASLPVAKPPTRARTPWLEALGQAVGDGLEVVLETLDVAKALLTYAGAALGHLGRARWFSLLQQMDAIGVQAVTVVGLISFLVGLTVALQSAAQLRQFGASIFVVDLVAVAITRELGPLMAAIVVAGRSGAAAAAEISTMVITEEVDALRTMGIHPVRYVLLPKFVAILLTQPLLAMLANTIAIFGSFLVAFLYLDISPTTFVVRLGEALETKDLLLGLVKSGVFGGLIMIIAAVVGLRTRGGADAVGRSTTVSVVAAIFAIIVADAAFSLTFYLGDL